MINKILKIWGGSSEYIISDLYRFLGHKPSVYELVKYYVRNDLFRYQVCHRLLNDSKCIIPKWYLKAVKKHIGSRRHLQIPNSTKIGYGLYLGHGIDIIINETAIIGNNCNLSQFLNIGSNKGKAAVIGDNVYIGPHVCIVENVKIGNNVCIGAGTIVVKDIPNNATCVGNPAKVVNYKNAGCFVKNKWQNKF